MKDIDFKDPETQKVTTGLIVGVLIVLASLTFLVVPKVSRLFALLSETSRLKTDMRSVQRDMVQIRALEKKRDFIKKQIAEYETGFLDASKIPVFLEELSELAKECNVKLTALKPMEVTTEFKSGLGVNSEGGAVRHSGGFYEEIPIYIRAECGYHPLGKFINRLEVGNRFVRITDIKIQGQREKPRLHKVDLIIETIANVKKQ